MGLVQFDQTLTIKPALAAFWRSSHDGLVWTFELRKDVKFHHGREVTADDVVYSFTRILDPKTRSGAAELFVNVELLRVNVPKLKRPPPVLPAVLALKVKLLPVSVAPRLVAVAP